MDITNMKRCSISLVIWEIQIRTLKKVMVFDLGVKDRLEEEQQQKQKEHFQWGKKDQENVGHVQKVADSPIWQSQDK